MTPELLTNQQINQLLGNGNRTIRCRDWITGIEWNQCVVAPRNDHFDVTPAIPQDMTNMQRAAGTLSWLSRSVIWFIGNRQVAMGQHSFMHGGRMAGGNPGPGFPSKSNNGPFNTPDGGHVCAYGTNSVGNTTAATTLPGGNNRLASAAANQRAANALAARGLHSRAACYDSFMRGGGTVMPLPLSTSPMAVSPYQIEITGSVVNFRTGPGTNHSIENPQARPPERFMIDLEQNGPDGDSISRWGRIANGPRKGRWIALRLTKQITIVTSETILQPGTWSMQAQASRNQTDICKVIGRLRVAGFNNLHVTYNNGWHQARVGPYLTRDAAMTIRQRLIDLGHADAFPVQNQ